MQFGTYANQNAYDTLRKIMTEQAIPETGKSTMEQLQKMGIAQGDKVGAEIMRKNLGDLMSKLSLYGGDLLQSEAKSTEAAGIRAEDRAFTEKRDKATRDWETAWRDEARSYAKSLEPSEATRKRKKYQALLQTLGTTAASAVTGGVAPGIFGAGTSAWKGAGLGALFGLKGTASIAGQNIGIQQFLQMMKGMGGTPYQFGNNSSQDISTGILSLTKNSQFYDTGG